MDIFGVGGFIAFGLVLFVCYCLISIDRKLNIGNQYLAAIHKALTAPEEDAGEEEPAPKPAKKEKRKSSS
jgi:hypothetical protein